MGYLAAVRSAVSVVWPAHMQIPPLCRGMALLRAMALCCGMTTVPRITLFCLGGKRFTSL